MRILLSALIIINLHPVCLPQTKTVGRGVQGTTRLDLRKPSAFITFEKAGKRTPAREGESDEGIWLRLHNNCKWKLYLKTYGADNENNEYRVSYDVQLIPGLEWRRKEVELPQGYRIINNARIRAIDPGKSIVFSVPREHLKDGFSILINFSYEWEMLGDSGGDLSIVHQAKFWATDLPTKE
jgi:hypothetical protein